MSAQAKAITLHQPWASLVAVGVKTIETRSWPTRYRGPLLIHAGKNVDAWEDIYHYAEGSAALVAAARSLVGLCSDLPLGAVVASCVLVDCVRMGWGVRSKPPFLTIDAHSPTRDLSDEIAFGYYEQGRYAWLLDDVKPVHPPVPMRGKQGLWNPPSVLESASGESE